MNDLLKLPPERENIALKNLYEKPTITTFGSVAKLTMGGNGSHWDGFFGRYHHHDRHHDNVRQGGGIGQSLNP
jgi:hypothetical protein